MNIFEKNWYLYFHRKPNGVLFYIGIGKVKKYHKRYRSSNNRNPHWKRTVAKHGGFTHKKVAENLTHEEACELEIFAIEEYGLKNLTNITEGGGGVKGKKSEESKKKMRIAHTGVPLKKHHVEAIRKSRRYGKDHFASRAVIDNDSGEVYESIREAAEAVGMKIRTLHAQLTGENGSKTSLTFLNKKI